MSDLTITIVLSLAAALMYALAAFFQQRAAYAQDRALSMHWRLLTRLVRAPVWLAGTTFDIVAYGFEATALGFGSLVVVQPLLVTGLLWTLPLATVGRHQRVTRREWIPAILLVASLAVFVGVGSPSGGRSNAPLIGWLVTGGLVALTVTVAILRTRGASPHRRALLLAFSAGCLYGLTAALTKSTVALLPQGIGAVAGHWQVYALAVTAAIALLVNQSAFHAGHLAASLPALTVTNPVVSCIIGVTLFGEHLQATGAAATTATGVAIVVMLAATVSLARSPLVTDDTGIPVPVHTVPTGSG